MLSKYNNDIEWVKKMGWFNAYRYCWILELQKSVHILRKNIYKKMYLDPQPSAKTRNI